MTNVIGFASILNWLITFISDYNREYAFIRTNDWPAKRLAARDKLGKIFSISNQL